MGHRRKLWGEPTANSSPFKNVWSLVGEAGIVLVSPFEYPSPHIFPGGSDGKESACNVENGFDPWLGRSPGERNGYPSILAWRIPNWWTTVHGGPKDLDMTKRLTDSHIHFSLLLHSRRLRLIEFQHNSSTRIIKTGVGFNRDTTKSLCIQMYYDQWSDYLLISNFDNWLYLRDKRPLQSTSFVLSVTKPSLVGFREIPVLNLFSATEEPFSGNSISAQLDSDCNVPTKYHNA